MCIAYTVKPVYKGHLDELQKAYIVSKSSVFIITH